MERTSRAGGNINLAFGLWQICDSSFALRFYNEISPSLSLNKFMLCDYMACMRSPFIGRRRKNELKTGLVG